MVRQTVIRRRLANPLAAGGEHLCRMSFNLKLNCFQAQCHCTEVALSIDKADTALTESSSLYLTALSRSHTVWTYSRDLQSANRSRPSPSSSSSSSSSSSCPLSPPAPPLAEGELGE